VNKWLDDLHDLRDRDERCVVVTVVGVRGSAPREIGAKMIVTGTATIGTIGGGQLEYQCTRIGVKQIQKQGAYGSERLQRRFPLGSNCGQCCGGVVDIMFERVTSSSSGWLGELKRLHDERRPVVVITPLDEAAGRYLVTEDRCMHFDRDVACADEATAVARRMIADNDSAAVLDNFLLEPIMHSEFHVAIFGAGHVGAATVDILSKLDCNLRWIDSRRNIFPASLPHNVTAVESGSPAREVAAMPRGTSYLVMTHSHPLDFEICDRVLRREDFAYCGLIGSVSKRRRFEREMRKQAMPDALLERLTCPIGVGGIASKKPADIAVAVAAELLRVRDAVGAAKSDNETVPDNVHVLWKNNENKSWKHT
jgi:xanthine dehydrogenase accessory factor